MIEMDDHKTGNVWLDLSIGLSATFCTILCYAQKIENKLGPMELLDLINDFFGEYGYMFVTISMVSLSIIKAIDIFKRWRVSKNG